MNDIYTFLNIEHIKLDFNNNPCIINAILKAPGDICHSVIENNWLASFKTT